MASTRLKHNLWFTVLGILIAGIAAGAVFLVSQTELLAVEHIVIEGNHVVRSEDINERAAPLLLGQSILKPSFDDVSRALDEYTYIESVEIDRDLPHTIVIHVREYRSFVTLAAAEGRYVVLSAENRALMQVPAPAQGFPLLTTKEACTAEPGQRVECPDVLTGNEFLGNIPTSFNQEITEVRVADGDITMRTVSGVTVHFGTLDDYELKFEVMRQLMARSAAAGETLSIDVSVVERPVTKGGNTSTTATTAAASGAGNAATEAAAAADAEAAATEDTGAADTGDTTGAAGTQNAAGTVNGGAETGTGLETTGNAGGAGTGNG